MISNIRLIRNIGTFDSVNSGAQLPLGRLALIYAENGRGKTTLAGILRSLATGDPLPIQERHRLGAQHPPQVVISAGNGRQSIFQNGAWVDRFPDVAVFDDAFVSQNVCSGLEVASDHRQNLHDLIIGARGVALAIALQEHIDRIEQHNRDLQGLAAEIRPEWRHGLNVDQFCALDEHADIEERVQAAERDLAAARQSDTVRQQAFFRPLVLPEIDLDTISGILARELPDLESAAVERVQQHFKSIGDGGENWVSDGMARIIPAADENDGKSCPFCAQDLTGSDLIGNYQAYFSDAYAELISSISEITGFVSTSHRGEIQAAFERDVSATEKLAQFWSSFTDIPDFELDTAAIARAWAEAVQGVASALHAKQAAPLQSMALDGETLGNIGRYHEYRAAVQAINEALAQTQPAIDLLKERAETSDAAALDSDLKALKAINQRYQEDTVIACETYLREKQAKAETEGLRDAAREALNDYRERVFPEYEASINEYLQRFNAGFRLAQVNSVNTRRGSSCTYNVLINQHEVQIAAGGVGVGAPSFRNTLSAGDRNTLALAFFFASLESDPDRAQKIVVIDDPMTSLDEHRTLTTIQQLRILANDVAQVVVLSHSRPFLCDIWQGADPAMRSAMRIARSNPGSTLAEWDVNQDCISEHDRRHALVRTYIDNSVGVDERAVASALRYILEVFTRVAYPEHFEPGALLGPFIGLCQQREGTPHEILGAADRIELRALLDFSNQFHHDTNPAYQTAIINDQELVDFARRTLNFAKR